MEKKTLEGVDQLGGWAWVVKTWSWKGSPGPSSGATQDEPTPSGGGGLASPRMFRPLHVQDQSALRSSCQPPSPVLESVLIFHPSPRRLTAPSFRVPVTHQSGPLSPPLGRPSLPGSPTPWAAGSLTRGDSGPTPAGVEILVLGKGGTLRIIMCLPGSVS